MASTDYELLGQANWGQITGNLSDQTDLQTALDAKLANIVEDTTPQLGGDLDAQGNNITDLGDVTFKTGAVGGTLRTGTSNADKFILQGYDTNLGSYVNLIKANAGNTPRLQLFADNLEIEDDTDATKQVTWDLSGATTGTLTDLIFSQTANRTITFPDSTGTLALTSDLFSEDHGDLTGLTDDDHSQYALLAGRSGGQTLIGDTASGGDLTLQSTSNATKGKILFGTSAYDEVNNRLGIGTNAPTTKLEVQSASSQLRLVDTDDNQKWDFSANVGLFTFTDATNAKNPFKIVANAPTDALKLHTTELIINDAGENYDFRVETASDPDMFFVDGTKNAIVIAHNDAILHANPNNPGGGNVTHHLNLYDTAPSGLALSRWANNSGATGGVVFTKSRGTSIGASGVVISGDRIGSLTGAADDGTDIFTLAAQVEMVVDGTPATNRVPGAILFKTQSTTADDDIAEVARFDAEGALNLFNRIAPTTSATNGIKLYAEDVSASSELKVRDEAGNITVLSPHHWELTKPSEEMAWSYHSERNGKKIEVDMLKLARVLEKLSGEKLVYIQ